MRRRGPFVFLTLTIVHPTVTNYRYRYRYRACVQGDVASRERLQADCRRPGSCRALPAAQYTGRHGYCDSADRRSRETSASGS